MFGGGTPDYVQGFDKVRKLHFIRMCILKMYYFDLILKRYAVFLTQGDPKAETPFPTPRRFDAVIFYIK